MWWLRLCLHRSVRSRWWRNSRHQPREAHLRGRTRRRNPSRSLIHDPSRGLIHDPSRGLMHDPSRSRRPVAARLILPNHRSLHRSLTRRSRYPVGVIPAPQSRGPRPNLRPSPREGMTLAPPRGGPGQSPPLSFRAGMILAVRSRGRVRSRRRWRRVAATSETRFALPVTTCGPAKRLVDASLRGAQSCPCASARAGGDRFCLTDPRRPKIRAAPGWQGGETKLYPMIHGRDTAS
jgi:hypothetical protein